MQRARAILRKGQFAPEEARDRVILDFDARQKRRGLLLTERNYPLLLQLGDASHIRDGDALVLADGALILVVAQPESLVEVRADRERLIRIAWHLGNRHCLAQLKDGALRVRADHVIEQMMRVLGGDVRTILAPFDPEGGAYEHGFEPDHTDDPFLDAARMNPVQADG